MLIVAQPLDSAIDQKMHPARGSTSLETGTFVGGLPYLRVGRGARPLLFLAGFTVDNRVPGGLARRLLALLFARYAREYTVYMVLRRSDMPRGYSLPDMARDYARVIGDHLGPCAVLGISTGGLIAQHLALDHPQLVTALVLGITGCRMSAEGRALMERARAWAEQEKWTQFYLALADIKQSGRVGRWLYRFMVRLAGQWLVPPPRDPSDCLTLIDADLAHDTTSRLPLLRVPTLVIGGAADIAFPEEILRETASLIPGARLRVFPGVGHDVAEKRKRAFEDEVLAFLRAHHARPGALPQGDAIS